MFIHIVIVVVRKRVLIMQRHAIAACNQEVQLVASSYHTTSISGGHRLGYGKCSVFRVFPTVRADPYLCNIASFSSITIPTHIIIVY